MTQPPIMNIPATELPRIVVIGGGFAGISFIKELRKAAVQIVLIDRHNYHTFQPLLYQVSTAGLEPDSIAYPLRKIFRHHNDFHFRMANVEQIDSDTKTVHTNIGQLTFDFLVIATGTRTNFFGNRSLAAASMPMKTVPQALDIRSLMLQNIEMADREEHANKRLPLLNFVVVGAGPTGVELAGALAEFRKGIFTRDYRHLNPEDMKVHLLEGGDRVLPAMTEKSSAAALRSLRKLGVEVQLNTLVTSYEDNVLTTRDGDQYHTATVIWSAGVTGAVIPGIEGAGFDQRTNRYRVDHFNKVVGSETVYALGDIALMSTERFPNGHPQVAQPAMQQGRNLGKNLLRSLQDRPMRPFKYIDKGSMATIGRNKAVCDIWGMSFSGTFAWMLWMLVHLWFLVGFRNRVVTFFNWTYNYINYDRAARLIIRPFTKGESTIRS